MMTHKSYILFLSSWYPTRVNPTLGNFNEKFAEAAALYRQVVAFHVCADAGMKETSALVISESEQRSTWIYYFRKKDKENLFDKAVKTIRFFKYYLKGLREIRKVFGKPLMVHLNILYPTGLIALYLKITHKTPYVISENWTGYLPSNKVKQGFAVRWLSRCIAAQARVLMPVTEDLKRAMTAEGFQGIYKIVPNVTDTRLFYPDFSRPVPDKKIILHVSSLKDEHKNISGIFNVMKRLYNRRTDFELHIVGDGDEKPHVRKALEMGLNNKCVFFFNAMTPTQVAEKMRQSDFFILFSNYENLPCVMVEAFASGLPVVSTTAGGIAEHLNEERGIILSPGDEEALFDACCYMLDNLKTYDKAGIHSYAVGNFSYNSVGMALDEIYTHYS